jgi:hypothetical protein
MKSILDPSFHYTNSVETDLRETFARVRRELHHQPQEPSTIGIEVTRKVLPFRSRKPGSEEQCVRRKRLAATGGTLDGF